MRPASTMTCSPLKPQWEDFVVEYQGVLWDEQVAVGFAWEEI